MFRAIITQLVDRSLCCVSTLFLELNLLWSSLAFVSMEIYLYRK